MVVPISEKFNTYAQWVERQLLLHGFHVESELSSKTLNKKVRETQLAQWNFIAVVGEKEAEKLCVNVRERDVERPIGEFTMLEFIAKLDLLGMPSSRPLRQFEAFR